MRLGIFAKTFPGTDPGRVLAAARAAGYDAVQYNMACSGLPPMPDAVPPEAASAIAEAAARAGIAIAALSGTYNMIHPDPAIRATGRRRLATLIEAAPAIGAPMVTLCTGTRDPDDQWRAHPGNAAPEAWSDLLRELEPACALAEAAGIRLGIEPEAANVVADAPRARRLLDELASPALAIVLDPANLAEAASPADRRALVEQAVDLLGPRIAMAHAKDRDPAGAVVPAGQGVIDFPHLVATLRRGGFDGDLVTHGLSADAAPAVAAHLRGVLSGQAA
jgi:sugar phosphate isomerase/epimerase